MFVISGIVFVLLLSGRLHRVENNLILSFSPLFIHYRFCCCFISLLHVGEITQGREYINSHSPLSEPEEITQGRFVISCRGENTGEEIYL